MLKRFNSKLFAHCKTEEEKDEMKATLLAAYPLILVLEDLIGDKIRGVRSNKENKKNYLNPSWAYSQADGNGEIRGLKFLLDLLSN